MLHDAPRHCRTRVARAFRSFSCIAGLALLSVVTAAGADIRHPGSQSAVAGSRDGSLADARSFLAEGKIEKAETAVRSYLKIHENSGDAHFLLGLILFRKIQAEATGKLAFADSNDSMQRGSGPRSREENARASLAEYTEGAKYERPSASDLKIVALDYVLLGSYADASKWLTQSVEENPKDAEAWYYLGRAKYNENRFEEAIRAFERCLELDPRNVKAQSNLGLSYAGLNRNPEALAAFLKAIEWQAGALRKNAEPYIDLGDLLIQQNRVPEAVEYLLQAVQIAPRESRAREKLGNAYLNLNDLAAAQSQLESGISFDPENPSLHYLLGTVYRKRGQQDKAKAELEQFQALKARGTGRP
ncbi:MAG TPA: tetratricopeptide repeat protein [Candidatus Eisenbacteria bacterium]|jgi:Flp pilus assembly protein TadD|nr:tetratricopeptide repeat protein [Candidatus Eisenbacteria bacterium]